MASTSQPEFLFGDSQSIDFAALAASNAASSSASGFTQSKPGMLDMSCDTAILLSVFVTVLCSRSQ